MLATEKGGVRTGPTDNIVGIITVWDQFIESNGPGEGTFPRAPYLFGYLN